MIFFKYTLLVLTFLATSWACGSQDKKDAADFFLKGNVALAQKNYTEALRLYDEAIAKNGDFSDAYLNKGISLSKLNRQSDAYDVLTEALRLDPTLAQANLVRAEVALDLGKKKEAREDLLQIAKEYQDSTRYYLVLGNLYEMESNHTQALANYDKALQLDNRNTEAYVNRGAIYYHDNNLDFAETDFKSALVLDPAQPQALNNLGLIETKRMKWTQAKAFFDQVLGRNPADAIALNNKGYVLLQEENMDEAAKLINRSLDLMPDNGYAVRNLGLYYALLGNFPKAIEQYQKAIDAAEPVELLYGLAGQAFMKSNQPAKACSIWKQGSMLKDTLAIQELARYCN